MFVKWTDIEALSHVARSQVVRWEQVGIPPETVVYRGKIKLHGTNAAVRVEDGKVYAQSRTQDVGTVDVDSGNPDNAGFAAWVTENAQWFRDRAVGPGTTLFFGEWCGAGIQKGCAIHQIGRKVFAIFAIQRVEYPGDEGALMVDPFAIKAQCLGFDPLPEGIHVLPWYGDEITINYGDRASLEKASEIINAEVERVEKADPWVQEVFGVEGTGEGIVYYPINGNVDEGFEERRVLTRTMFKAKGEKHRVKKDKKAAVVDVEKLASVNDFAEAFVTEARCEQAVAEGCGGVVLMPNMGAFLAWISRDVEKESQAELEESGLTWKEVNKAVMAKARTWFMAKAKMGI